VLETARGGILLRGVAFESNEVSVFTNVSADHLDLQGIRTLQGLAEVKSVVVRVTKAGGTAVLNADDPLVTDASRLIAATKLLFSLRSDSPVIVAHVSSGGRAIVHDGERLMLIGPRGSDEIALVRDLPIAHGGRATHMIENAMAASGAAIGLGLDLATIRRGLTTFRNTADQNLGRLNIFDLGGVTIVLDYAHNEAGAQYLIEFARTFLRDSDRLTIVIGTAGDRTDQTIEAIGRMAAEAADRVVIKASPRYLRGRDIDEMIALYQRGIRQAGKQAAPVAPTELDGLKLALENTEPGDVVALMCQEQMVEITKYLAAAGALAV
jgi:cyanophycin synthetase